MSNSTASATSSLIDTLTETFLTWFQSDILPVCATIVDILVIIVGVALNILLIVTFRKRGLLVEPSSHILLMLSVVDFLSYAFLLLPTIITALARDWVLSDPFCRIHGACLFLFVFASFGFATVLCLERTLKLCTEDSYVYERLFERKKIRTIIIAVTWSLAVFLAFLPATGLGDIRYDFYHQGCKLNYNNSWPFLIVYFLMATVFPTVTVLVCYSLIFYTRKKAVDESRLASFQKVNHKTGVDSRDNPLPTIAEDENDDDDEKGETNTSQAASTKQGTSKAGKRNRPKSTRRQSVLFEVFSDDEENPAFHLSLTYLYVWGATFICCFPYFIICFYDTFNDNAVWGGFFTVTVLIIHVSFTVKPVIYLGHNRHYQQVTKETIPEGVKKRARSMRTSVANMADTVEDFIFKSRANKQFNAALATQKAVLIWKKKLKTRKANSKSETKTPVIPAAFANHAAPGAHKTSNVPNVPEVNHTVHGRTSVTPSDVKISSTTSSFIEKERQRMLGAAHSHPKPSDSPDNISPIPGMVEDKKKLLNV